MRTIYRILAVFGIFFLLTSSAALALTGYNKDMDRNGSSQSAYGSGFGTGNHSDRALAVPDERLNANGDRWSPYAPYGHPTR